MTNSMNAQMVLDLGHREALGREDFLVSDANQDAVRWIDLWPRWPSPVLILQGPAACGKSHLSAVWQEKSKAAFIKAEELTTHEADTLANRAETIILDHIDPWISDKSAETTLFHLYNIIKSENRTMLITMRMSPAHADFAVPDLASRLRAAPLASIAPPDDDLLAAVLVKLFNDRQLQISTEVLAYILPRMDRSFDAACELVSKADKKALAEKRAITIPLIRAFL